MERDRIQIDFGDPQRREEVVDAVLVITRLSFDGSGRWGFLWNGMKIGMTIRDGALMKAIDDGERFGKGDALKVKMKVVRQYDPDLNAYVNKSYRIEEFLEHVKSPSVRTDIFGK